MSTDDHTQAVNALIARPFSRHGVRTYVFAAFAGIAFYNAIELVVLCFVSFKVRRGCYFWSLLVASASVIPYTLGTLLFFYPTGVSLFVCSTLGSIGWVGMVTGQSLVLWSRLYLLLQNSKLLWGVLWMIIIDAVLLHTPMIVLLYGVLSTFSDEWERAFRIMVHIQLIWFCVQELIISGIYIWETVKLLQLRPEGPRYNILRHLLAISIIILILDVAVVVIEYVGYYGVQAFFKPVAYSVKLKLEYAILGQLVAISRTSSSGEEPSGRGIISPPSPQEPLSRIEPRHVSMEHSLPWSWDNP